MASKGRSAGRPVAADGPAPYFAMHCIPLRLVPGSDLRSSLEAAASAAGMSAFVLSGIGSLADARLRLAGADSETLVPGQAEILCLSGTVTPDGAHLHMAVADGQGRVVGGHVCYGNAVRTTAEVLLAQLPEWSLGREHDPGTGYKELVIRRVPVEQENAAPGLQPRAMFPIEFLDGDQQE